MIESGSRQLLRNATLSISAMALTGWVLAWALRAALGLGVRYLYMTALLLAGGTLLLLWRLMPYHPFDRFGAANLVTVMRGVLALLLAGLIGMGQGWTLESFAFGIAATAAMLDAVDGRLARRGSMSSPYGARFDMECDAFLILVLSVLAWQFDKAGAWILAAGLLRYVFVAVTWVLPWMRAPLPPSRRRKAVAALQAATLVAAIAPWMPATLTHGLCAGALALLAGSFLLDIAWLWRR